MKFLIKLYQLLIKFFQKPKKVSNAKSIPAEIAGDELIVRGIVHPLFLSKRKLTDNAYLPPKENGRKDVSVLRHDYTNTTNCKKHIKNNVSIRGNEYCGLAVLLAKSIKEVNNINSNLIFENGERLTIDIVYSPMDNLEMHSDIIYSHGITIDEPNTLFRKLAKSLKNKSKYLHDPNPKENNWTGEIINISLFQ